MNNKLSLLLKHLDEEKVNEILNELRLRFPNKRFTKNIVRKVVKNWRKKHSCKFSLPFPI